MSLNIRAFLQLQRAFFHESCQVTTKENRPGTAQNLN